MDSKETQLNQIVSKFSELSESIKEPTVGELIRGERSYESFVDATIKAGKELTDQLTVFAETLRNDIDTAYADLFELVTNSAKYKLDKATDSLNLWITIRSITSFPVLVKLLERQEYKKYSDLPFSELVSIKDENGDLIFTSLLQTAMEIPDLDVLEDIDMVYVPTDRTTSKLFSFSEILDVMTDKEKEAGRIDFDIDTRSQHDKIKNTEDDDISIAVTLIFDEIKAAFPNLPLSELLTAFDERVFSSVLSSRLNYGKYMSLYKIANDCGFKNPKTNDIKKIINSIVKMSRIWIAFDNYAESQKYRYKHLSVDLAILLPVTRIRIPVLQNGRLQDIGIFMADIPAIWQLSKDRNNQYLTLKSSVRQMPDGLNLTSKNIVVQDYLIKQIRHMKAGRRDNNIINTEKLFNEKWNSAAANEETTKKNKQRFNRAVKLMLEKFKNIDHEIDGYKFSAKTDRITIDVLNPKLVSKAKKKDAQKRKMATEQTE